MRRGFTRGGLCVNVCPVNQKQFDNVHITSAGSSHKWRYVSLDTPVLYIGVHGQQNLKMENANNNVCVHGGFSTTISELHIMIPSLLITSHSNLSVTYLCKFIVAGRAGKAKQALPFLCVFVDAPSLIQQFAHCVDIPV